MTGCGTQCHGLLDKVVISQRLDSLILEVFSNRNDSMVLLNADSASRNSSTNLFNLLGHSIAQTPSQDRLSPGETQRDVTGWRRAEQAAPVRTSTETSCVTTGCGLGANQSMLFVLFPAGRRVGWVRAVKRDDPVMSLRGSLTLQGGLDADLQDLGHSRVGQRASIWWGCTCCSAGSLPAVVLLRWIWAGGGRTLSYTHPSPVEIPPNPQSAQPSSINSSYFFCYFCCPLVFFPGAGTFTLSSGLARLPECWRHWYGYLLYLFTKQLIK